MSTGFIWDRKSGNQIAWIEQGTDVFSVETKRKFATIRGSDLYSLAGEFLGVHLENLENMDGGIPDVAGAGNDSEALARFKELASVN
jgi:hypothetical protein